MALLEVYQRTVDEDVQHSENDTTTSSDDEHKTNN